LARERKMISLDPEKIRREAEELIRNFESELRSGELRSKVLALVPVFNTLRELGKSLITGEYKSSARDRILYYLLKYPRTVIDGDELLVVSGIQEYARRVRELRVQFGWSIASGVTIKEMCDVETEDFPRDFQVIKPSEYVLLDTEQDREAAHRWNTANAVRRLSISTRDKILMFLREHVGRPVTGEELRYVAGNSTEWARRIRELRTEYGWPISTKTTGSPNLAVGVYLLQADRQSPEHDRLIPDNVRREVLRRDEYRCKQCNWSHAEWNPSDPRHLELHHITHHAKGGDNVMENLKTLCNVCHDRIHETEK
jgi:hypothetical protein